ncbi:MAG: hypothetical protein EOP11_19750, partial [Proteobacteria bacterium]
MKAFFLDAAVTLTLTAAITTMAACVGPGAEAGTVTKGKIYASEAAMDAPLYLYENNHAEEGGKTFSRSRYSDPQGKALVEEEVIYEAGKLKQHTYVQHQTEERGTIDVNDGKVYYVFINAKGTKTGSDKWNDDMLLPDMLGQRIADNWELLNAGENLKVRFLALEVQDNFGFKIFKEGESTFQGKPVVDLAMKATGFFVALAAPSFKFAVEKEAPHRLLKMDGRL